MNSTKPFFFVFNIKEIRNIKEVFLSFFFIITYKFFFYGQNKNFKNKLDFFKMEYYIFI